MTNPSPQGFPITAALQGKLVDTAEADPESPTVGSSDAAADAARSGADVDQSDATHDSDGVPVGLDDVEADRRASGA
jgi:hypothetical protein